MNVRTLGRSYFVISPPPLLLQLPYIYLLVQRRGVLIREDYVDSGKRVRGMCQIGLSSYAVGVGGLVEKIGGTYSLASGDVVIVLLSIQVFRCRCCCL